MTRKYNTQRSKKVKQTSGDSVGEYIGDAWSLAKRTAVGLNEIRKLINIETKFHDVTISATDVSTTAIIQPLSMTAQGLTSTDRIGDSIKLQHIEYALSFSCVSGSIDTIRVILFRDLDNMGSAPVVTDVLEAANAWSPRKFNKLERISVLADDLIVLDVITHYQQVIKHAMAHGGHVKYLGTEANAASNGKGSLYLLILGNLTGNMPKVTGVGRILFTDD